MSTKNPKTCLGKCNAESKTEVECSGVKTCPGNNCGCTKNYCGKCGPPVIQNTTCKVPKIVIPPIELPLTQLPPDLPPKLDQKKLTCSALCSGKSPHQPKPPEKFSCSCKFCKCYVCNDGNEEAKILQEQAPTPGPIEEPCLIKDPEEFACSCVECTCYVCDDAKVVTKIDQDAAPGPKKCQKVEGPEIFSCSCDPCICYVCDDEEYKSKLVQEKALEPVEVEPEPDNYICECVECLCYVCDDQNFEGKLQQIPAPPPEEEKPEKKRCSSCGPSPEMLELLGIHICNCKECNCYICDDARFARKRQKKCPAPDVRDPDEYVCECLDCICYVCDNPRHAEKKIQEIAPPPIEPPRLCSALRTFDEKGVQVDMSHPDIFICNCNPCMCYVCDDEHLKGTKIQEEAPPPQFKHCKGPCRDKSIPFTSVPKPEYLPTGCLNSCVCVDCICIDCKDPNCKTNIAKRPPPSKPKLKRLKKVCRRCEKKLKEKLAAESMRPEIPDPKQFSCVCTNCNCYVCDDPNISTRLKQDRAPAPNLPKPCHGHCSKKL